VERLKEYDAVLSHLETDLDVLTEWLSNRTVDRRIEILAGAFRIKEKMSEIRFRRDKVQACAEKLLESLGETKILSESDVQNSAIDLSQSGQARCPGPPVSAFFLLDLLLAKVDREVIPGDMEEEYRATKLPKYGPKGAGAWFWVETLRVVAVRNPVFRWILLAGLTRVGRWVMGLIGG
jgi:hypothetical protein